MKSAFIASIAILALAALPTAANAAPYESGEELLPSQITLPSVADGTVAVQICSACKRWTYTLNTATRFYVADREVSYAELKSFIASKPNAVVHLVTLVNKTNVTRLEAE